MVQSIFFFRSFKRGAIRVKVAIFRWALTVAHLDNQIFLRWPWIHPPLFFFLIFFFSSVPPLAQQLETDSKILLEKAEMALKKYKMHLVVANELETRKEVVVVVTSSEKISVHRDKNEASADVESPLIKLLVEKHSSYIEGPDFWFLSLHNVRWLILAKLFK